MLVKYWKSFKWFLFIPLIVFCFVFNIKNVKADIIAKENISLPIVALHRTGVITNNQSNNFIYDFDSDMSTTGYDLFAFTFYRFNVYGSESIFLSGQDTTTETANFYCTYGTSGYCSQATITSSSDTTDLNGNVTVHDVTIQGKILDSDGKENLCYMSDNYKNMMFCPVSNMKNIHRLQVFLFSNGRDMQYSVSIYPLGYHYNYDTTDLYLQQQTTNTNLQYIYQYQQNDSVSGSTTQVQGDFSDLAQSFNSELQGVNDLSQLVLLPISLFMDLSTDNCQPLHLVVPFVNTSVDLPCMKAIFNTYFSGFYTIFTTIMSAVICYWVAIKTGALVKEIVDCDNDRIEVVDL